MNNNKVISIPRPDNYSSEGYELSVRNEDLDDSQVLELLKEWMSDDMCGDTEISTLDRFWAEYPELEDD